MVAVSPVYLKPMCGYYLSKIFVRISLALNRQPYRRGSPGSLTLCHMAGLGSQLTESSDLLVTASLSTLLAFN
jgi:hypothetical protein